MKKYQSVYGLSDPKTHQPMMEDVNWQDCAGMIALYLFMNTQPNGVTMKQIDKTLLDKNPTEIFDKCKKWIDQLISNNQTKGAK